VDSAHDHRPRKIRRTGRHSAPSQVEKVAERAGKAAPAVAIAGVLVAMPQAHAAVKSPAKTDASSTGEMKAIKADTDALVTTKATSTTYTVKSGDTLASIAENYYHNSSDWTWIYDANKSKISNPNSIYVGEKLTIPYHAPTTTGSYTPKHAKTSTTVLTTSTSKLSGTLGCSGLESLWKAAGGASAEAFTAAEIAMAESGGNQYAHSPTNDYGYWQINGVHGPSMATYDPMGNAKAAVSISDNGRDWAAWTTYTSGAYEGRC